jgi:hypothetical protein
MDFENCSQEMKQYHEIRRYGYQFINFNLILKVRILKLKVEKWRIGVLGFNIELRPVFNNMVCPQG